MFRNRVFVFLFACGLLLGLPSLIAGAMPGTAPPPNLPMQRIPAGEFAIVAGYTVRVEEFFIGVYEVSNANYALCVDEGVCTPPEKSPLGDDTPYFGTADFADYPVLGVTQEQAAAFCAWAGFRLPTAVEWQKAAGWDPVAGQMRRYPWGDDFTGTEANLARVGETGSPEPVAAYEAGQSAYHLYNMSGNAAEWVVEGVLMGGSWLSAPEDATTARREPLHGATTASGFRCASSCPVCAEVITLPNIGIPGILVATATPAPTETETPPPPEETETPSPLPTETPIPEPVGDVMDYDLTQPATGPGAEQADMTGASITLYGQPVPPTGRPAADLDGVWGERTPGPVRELAWGEEITREGTAHLTYGTDATLWIEGTAWSADFIGPDEGVILTGETTLTAVFLDTWTAPLPPVTLDVPGTTFVLGGANAIAIYDEDSGGTDIYLIEGNLELIEPEKRAYSIDGKGETALYIRVNPDGTVTQDSIPVASIQDLIPAELRTITINIEMAQPVARSSNSAEQVWITQMDLDGNPNTGLLPTDPAQMFTGLGADLLVRVELQENGTLDGQADFYINDDVQGQIMTIRTGGMPVEATLSADRQRLVIKLPLLDVVRQLRAALNPNTNTPIPMPLSTVHTHWRVGSINYTPEDQPKDIIPELGIGYPPPSDLPAPPEPTVPPPDAVTQVCTATANQNANLRAGPETTYDRVDGVTAGETVTITGQNAAGDWYRLRLDDAREAWIASFLLSAPDCPDEFTLPVVQ